MPARGSRAQQPLFLASHSPFASFVSFAFLSSLPPWLPSTLFRALSLSKRRLRRAVFPLTASVPSVTNHFI
jgi:hypothetical protein